MYLYRLPLPQTFIIYHRPQTVPYFPMYAPTNYLNLINYLLFFVIYFYLIPGDSLNFTKYSIHHFNCSFILKRRLLSWFRSRFIVNLINYLYFKFIRHLNLHVLPQIFKSIDHIIIAKQPLNYSMTHWNKF